jgi:GAF domain-containing protein
MTESEWDTCDTWSRALNAVNRATRSANAGWRRKFRLLGVYALRRIARLAEDGRFAQALDLAERHFDGRAAISDLRAAITEAQRGYDVHLCDLGELPARLAQALDSLLEAHPYQAAHSGCSLATRFEYELVYPHGRAVRPFISKAASTAFPPLIRDLFGNPFRPVAFDPAWRTSTAVALASQMYESRDFAAMPILADALQDAGCEDADVLNHCRSDGPHVRGCWVVDLVLGKA